MEQLASLLPLLLLLGIFYLLILRPARNRQRQVAELQASLVVGQDVMTTSGLHGQIVELHDTDVVLEVAPGVRTRWARAAVASIAPDAAPAAEEQNAPVETGEAPMSQRVPSA